MSAQPLCSREWSVPPPPQGWAGPQGTVQGREGATWGGHPADPPPPGDHGPREQGQVPQRPVPLRAVRMGGDGHLPSAVLPATAPGPGPPTRNRHADPSEGRLPRCLTGPPPNGQGPRRDGHSQEETERDVTDVAWCPEGILGQMLGQTEEI